MNQTEKRLKIINLAISITDLETIQLQVLKLGLLKTDLNIQNIITALQAENYAHAQALISKYMETSTKEILQRTSQKEIQSKEEEDIIAEFDLFITPSYTEEKQSIDINAFLAEKPYAKEPYLKRKRCKDSDFDAMLNLTTDDILADNVNLDSAHTHSNTFFEPEQETKEESIYTEDIPKDTFFDSFDSFDILKREPQIKPNIPKESITIQSPEINIETQEDTKVPKKIKPSHYPAISYIDQKFTHIKRQYPSAQKSEEDFSSVDSLLKKISDEGYSEKEIEETLSYVIKLSNTDKQVEASELLLLAGATESQYAQFILARELYRGDLLKKNISESFTLINRLAMDDYPEALCDLGQFYENGIGVAQDIKQAEQLYKEAMDLGIKRAEKHYERTKEERKGLFSAFKK